MSKALEEANAIHQRARELQKEPYPQGADLVELLARLAKSHATLVARMEVAEAKQSREIPKRDPDTAD